MKNKALLFLSATITLLISSYSCEKNNEEEFESIGSIERKDLTKTTCSGGWVIDLDEDDKSYRIESVPERSGIDLENATFPIKIKLNWKLDRICGPINYIIINQLEIIEKIYKSNGTIIGYDKTMTPCSGGWIIDLDEDDKEYRIVSMPENSGIDIVNATFPISVKLNWSLKQTCASINHINVDEIIVAE